MRKFILLLVAVVAAAGSLTAQTHRAPAPLFRDPVTDGPADPCIFYNYDEQAWWILYTQRRANSEAPGPSFCYATKIGIAESRTNGASWRYRGTLDLEFERGVNTFWAPGIVYWKGTYHLFSTYVRGAATYWGGDGLIAHYTSKNGWDWKYREILDVGHPSIIDPALYRDEQGVWHIWYKNCANSAIYTSTSRDLKHWSEGVQVKGVNPPCEAPKVFRMGDYYWMMTDPARGTGLCVYRSTDMENWQEQGRILTDGSNRMDDYPSACHNDVVVFDDRAYIFYATHPGEDNARRSGMPTLQYSNNQSYDSRRSSLQCAELKLENGELKCVRTDFEFFLPTLKK